MKKIKPVIQLTRTECGLCCIAMLTAYYGYEKPIRYFRELIEVGRDGISIAIMKDILMELNFDVSVYHLRKINYEKRADIYPAIIHTKSNHFMILENYNRKSHLYVAVDPARGRIKIDEQQIFEISDDFIISVTPNDHFSPEKEKDSIWKPLSFIFKKIGIELSSSLLLSILTYIFTLTIPLLIQIFIDRLDANKGDILSQMDLSLVLGAILLFLVISYVRNKIIVKCEIIVDRNLLISLMGHILHLPYKYFETRTTGEMLFRINLLNSIRLLISEGFVRGLIDAGSIIFILIYMSVIAPQLIIVVLLILLLIFAISNTINNRIVSLNKEELVELTQINNIETETVEMMFDIKCLGVEDLFLKRLKEQYERFQIRFKKREMLSRCNISLLQFFQLFVPFILLLANILIINNTNITIGKIVAFYSLSNMAITNCIALLQEITNFRIMKNYILRINDILYEKMDLSEGNKEIQEFNKVEVNNLCFKYSKNSNMVLKDISMCVTKGQKIAIVGSSGVGKSTLVKLLLGFYKPTSGAIIYNDNDISQYNRKELAKIVGIMPQDARLFNGSIRYNLTLGDDTISNDTIEHVLKRVNIYEEIMSMPLKIQTIVSVGGGNLSGGQRQRIALARILISNPQLIILDEATSSLDGINEKEIMNVLNECNCAQIIVSHRFSTILQADYIYLINDSVLAESGTLKELIARGGLFYKLFNKQIEASNLIAKDRSYYEDNNSYSRKS